DIDEAIQRFAQDTHSRYQFLKSDRERPVLPPEMLFLDAEALFVHLKEFPRLALVTGGTHPEFDVVPDVAVARRADNPLARLQATLYQGDLRLVLCADSAGRRETLLQMLAEYDIRPDANADTL